MISKMLMSLSSVAILLVAFTSSPKNGAHGQGTKSDNLKEVLQKYEKQSIFINGSNVYYGKATLTGVGEDYIAIEVAKQGRLETILYYLPTSKIAGIRHDAEYPQLYFN